MKRNLSLLIIWRWVAFGLLFTLLAGCAETEFIAQTAKRVAKAQDGGAVNSIPTGAYKVGKPYKIGSSWYYPSVDYEYSETGIASWYGSKFHGRETANGERYDMNELTAAHRTLPMPSFVRVTNLENGRSIALKINDRGPFARGRIVDVSRRAAQLLGFEAQGTARVRVDIMAPQSRVIAARMQGQAQIASVGSPLTVDRLPTVAVDTQSLPPPPGGKAAEESQPNAQLAPLPDAKAIPIAVETQNLPDPVVGMVSSTNIQPTTLYVQAGAYTIYQNAHRVQARLTSIGPVQISSTLVNDRDFFRVRVGPISGIQEADAVLEQVVSAGYNDAKIIVVH
jgi:peptidoglycan lytic transglycosylase